ncbi:MAG: 5'/3'-nucleotidase SurE [Thermoguttaceae bacterium]|nr:5'/3'-nucleotidase SurE [Thermoguttaceae bacterium]
MLILLTNDDGIFSPGLAAMAQALQVLGDVWVVAPAAEQSGVACSITFRMPLLAKEVHADGIRIGFAVEGSPVDCVKFGMAELLPGKPDLVVSGINNGLNTGINVLYSGTLAGAFEGAARNVPSFAVSISHEDSLKTDRFQKGAAIALELIQKLLVRGFYPGGVYNINIPGAAIDSPPPREVCVVPVDRHTYWQKYEHVLDPLGRSTWWLGEKPMFDQPENETDMGIVSQGKIAISPLTVDSTRYDILKEMKSESLRSDVPNQCANEGNISPIRMIRK